MDKIKAVFVDFDWTLYDHNIKSLNMNSIDALKTLQKKGIKVFINSARTYYSLKGMDDIFDKIHFDGYVCSNGLISLTDDEIIDATIISNEYVEIILKIARKHKISYLLTTAHHSYLKIYSHKRIDEFYSVFHEPRGLDIMSKCPKDIKVYAIQLYFDDSKDYLFKDLHEKFVFHRFFKGAVEIQGKFKSKADGMLAMLKHFKISTKHTLAIGDGVDDIFMFRNVKFSICMGNGHELAKKSATYVTDNIENDGLVNGLKYYKLI